MVKDISIFLIAFLITACSTAPVSETDTEIAVTGPQATWQMVFPKGNWELSRSRVLYDGKTNYMLYGDSKTRQVLSIMITKPPSCTSAVDCRQYWWTHRGAAFQYPLGVEEYESNGFAGVSFVVSAFKKSNIGQANYSSHTVHDGYWVDVRVSKLAPTVEDLRPMEQFIRNVRFVDTKRDSQ